MIAWRSVSGSMRVSGEHTQKVTPSLYGKGQSSSRQLSLRRFTRWLVRMRVVPSHATFTHTSTPRIFLIYFENRVAVFAPDEGSQQLVERINVDRLGTTRSKFFVLLDGAGPALCLIRPALLHKW
ncbi:MAG: hypothetical protein CMJ64_26295 [Planctomycetaceae bacterium]|nr:hypothetical protein [Planctomycetaceae bacterium]